jgi:alpha-beta hydrolase superfamily lysophospholipase
MKVKFKKLHKDAVSPKFAHKTDAGADLTATSADFSRDRQVGLDFVADQYTFLAAAAKVFGVPNAIQLFFTPSRKINKQLPLLIQAGSDDPIGGERGIQMLANTYRNKSGLENVTAIIYHDARHEIYNEINKDEVIHDLLGFIKENVG